MIAVIYVTLCAFAIVQTGLYTPAVGLSLVRVSFFCGLKIKLDDSIDKNGSEVRAGIIQCR
ncbi:hypothetical protein [Serratia marcescens]|uniref:hypothetical protein n=1 Tax=Serratia marcescens TaxID=615 RepID=UPI000F7F89F6|nr:hypothetical protein [Serratia marcescens]